MSDPFNDAKAWDVFCDAMKAAGRQLLGPDYPSDSRDRAEGFLHLAKLFEMSLAWQLDGADPDFPRLVTLNDTFELADNRFAAVRGDASYTLTGNVSTLFDINLSLHDGWPWLGQRQVWGDIGLSDLEVSENGDLTVVLSPDEQPGNWLPLPAEARVLQIREYYEDWSLHSPGVFEITRLGSEGQAPPRMTSDALAMRLAAGAQWAAEYTPAHMTSLIAKLRALPANTVMPPGGQGGGNRNIAYGFGRFELAEDQSMILEFEAPHARLWGVHWLTLPWYENPDMVNRSTSVNSHDAFVNDDGRVRLVVGASDSGAPNWLDTNGFDEGVLVARFVWGDGAPIELTTSVQRTSDVMAHLPVDTPAATAAQRQESQRIRRTHLARRRR